MPRAAAPVGGGLTSGSPLDPTTPGPRCCVGRPQGGDQVLILLFRSARLSAAHPALSVSATLVAAFAATAVQAQAPDRAAAGVGVAVVPAYQGSDETRVRAVPILDLKLGRFYANSADGAGLFILDSDRFRLGGGLSFVRGQADQDLPTGVEDLSNSAGATLLARYAVGRTGFTLDATRALGGAEGTTVEARVSQVYRVNRRLVVIPSVAATWADDKTMAGYFGIDEDESLVSGLKAFTPAAGMRDLAVAVSARYYLTRTLSLNGALGASTLLGDAADSPLTERRTAPFVLVGLSHAF